MRLIRFAVVLAALLVACDGGTTDGSVSDADATVDDTTEDAGPDTVVDDTAAEDAERDTSSPEDTDVAEDSAVPEDTDVGEDTAVPTDTDVAEDDTTGSDTVAPSGVRLVWDLDSARAATAEDTRFFDYPWPEGERLDPDGSLDLRGFPNAEAATGCSVSASSPIVTLLLQAIALTDYRDYVIAATDRSVRGYGTNTPIYFQFDGAIGDALPSPADTLGASATVQLVDVDPASADRGLRTPVVTRIVDDSRYLPPHTLALAPFPGFPLAPGTRYAAVVLRSQGDAAGAPLETPAALDALLAATPESSPQAARYASALTELEAAGVSVADIAAITVFTTDDPVAPLAAAADAIAAIASPGELAAIEITAVSRDGGDGYWRVSGTLNTLDWQRGTPPYLPAIRPNFPIDMDHLGDLIQPGGWDVDFDAEDVAGALIDGPAPTAPGGDDPDTVRTERIRFELALPLATLDAGGDPTGVPLVLYGHGTGGSERSPLGDGRAASVLAPLGIATFSIPAVMHDDRAHPDNLDPALLADLQALSELLNIDAVTPLLDVVVDGSFFFNPLAVEAGRGNVLQSGVDYLWLAHLFAREGLTIPLPDDLGGGTVSVTFDSEHLAFMGHSQGGLTGPLTALSPHLSATMLSAPGGHLASSLLTKEKPADPFAVKDLFAWVVCDPDALDTLHPFIGLLSTFFEAADGLNYARALVAEPVAGARHVFVTEGTEDNYATPPANEALTTAARLNHAGPVLSPVAGQALLDVAYGGGFTPVTSALSGNIVDGDGAWTAGFKQYHGDGGCADDHFVYLCVDQARQDWARFFETWLTPGPPEIPAEP